MFTNVLSVINLYGLNIINFSKKKNNNKNLENKSTKHSTKNMSYMYSVIMKYQYKEQNI